MKKLILTLSLLFLSADATMTMAGWILVSESDKNGGYAVYADLATKSGTNDEVKIWALLDYKIEQEDTGIYFLSEKVRRKFDCRTKHVKLLAFKQYSWNMGQGELVRAYSQPQQWEEIQPGSIDEIEWKTACGNE
ncbi:MAG: hypothetical protein MRK00_08050 [Nitrosomonas sp.]|nr:hypothetical protein [Nitrosomonas sp.]